MHCDVLIRHLHLAGTLLALGLTHLCTRTLLITFAVVGCCLQLLGEASAFFSAPHGSRGVAAGSVCVRGEMEG